MTPQNLIRKVGSWGPTAAQVALTKVTFRFGLTSRPLFELEPKVSHFSKVRSFTALPHFYDQFHLQPSRISPSTLLIPSKSWAHSRQLHAHNVTQAQPKDGFQLGDYEGSDIIKSDGNLTVRFNSLKTLSPDIQKALKEEFKYETMTKVQNAVLSKAPITNDLFVKAKTGTGKTLAFLIPAVETALKNFDSKDKTRNVTILAISPTRELAQQIAAEAKRLVKFLPFEVHCLVGGESKPKQTSALMSRRVDIIVATPGRLTDILESLPDFRHQCSKMKTLILDEADQLLEMGFRQDIERLLKFFPKQRQTFLFSATISPDIRKVAGFALRNDHTFIDTVDPNEANTNTQVKQSFMIAPWKNHLQTLRNVIVDHQALNPMGKIMMFLPTRKATELYAEIFRIFGGIQVFEIQSGLNQSQRTRVSERFRSTKSGAMLVTSDVSARGIDYPGVTLVLQVGAPSSRDQYIHRLGRTGRAGREGQGVLVLAPFEQKFTKRIHDLPVKPMEVPMNNEDDTVNDALNRLDTGMVTDAYRAFLGYYMACCDNLGIDRNSLKEYGLGFCQAFGVNQPRLGPRASLGFGKSGPSRNSRGGGNSFRSGNGFDPRGGGMRKGSYDSFSDYDKSKLFFNYEATVGLVIAVIKKTIKVSGSENSFKAVVSRKKRKEGVLVEGIDNRGVAAEAPGAHSWSSETGDTTESESIDIKKECLVEETSVDYGESGAFTEGDPNQTPKGLCVKTKKMLGKPLSVIDYDTVNTDNDVVNGFGEASTPSKFGGIIRATFTLEKTMMAAGKLANDHGIMVNTDLKHSAIVMKKIPVKTSMKAVHAVMSEFGLIKLIKMQLVSLWQKAIIELENQNQADLLASKWSILIGKDIVHVARADVDKQTWDSRDKFKALLYTFPVRTNAHNLWDFVGSVGGKTCVIDHNPVSYTYACCTIVCFGFESDLVSVMAATPVIKRIGLHWSHLFLALCSVCGLSGYTSLNCVLVKVGSILRGRKAPLSAQDQIRLATIYARKSAPISCSLVFSGKTWASVVGAPLVHNSYGAGSLLGSDNVGKPLPSAADDLEKCLVCIESSLVSLVGQIGELAKRLELFMLAVSQLSPGCQLPVTPPLQNQGEDIVMGMGLGDATSDKTAAVLSSTASPEVVKLENMLEGFSALIMCLSVCLNGLALAGGALPLSLSQ
ncbi:hypothetical protein G9A89_012643 [Geosiphon pyriformis]|nr:hypothetical protein G9A89_012643 [Geosiphon pyriformis]